jgi:diguanylate cyclase (GGDEF)-like protein
MAGILALKDGQPTLLAGIGLSDQAAGLAQSEAARLTKTLAAKTHSAGVQAPETIDASTDVAIVASTVITDAAGEPMGALVVLDTRPRAASARQRQALADLASVVSLSLTMQHGLERLTLLAITDPLTGLYNRRGLDLLFQEHRDKPMALLAVDIDDFKSVNDAHGHSAGDAMLKEVADTLRQSVRASDIIARIGGDEFLILLPGTTELGIATQVAARIHQAMSAGTVSIGIAQSSAAATPGAIKTMAEQHLRIAKQSGKACTFSG